MRSLTSWPGSLDIGASGGEGRAGKPTVPAPPSGCWAAAVGSIDMQDSVTVHIDAPIAEVWALVSDVTRIGEFSPETFEAEWQDGATGPEVGARFRGHVKRNEKGPTYWTTCEVTESEPGRVFAFAVLTKGKPLNVWKYELAPSGDGTDATESFTLIDNVLTRIWRPLGGFLRERRNERDMRRTLERVRDVAESPDPAE